MKELKKLSLKNEIDKEARKTDEEIRNRHDLDDITVSDDLETSLFNKIQDYEYDKRFQKTIRRSRKKRRILLAVAAMLILIFGSVITGTGSKSYWKVLMDRLAGDEQANIINVENMETNKTEDINEIEVFNQIRRELGISPVHLGYMPESMYLKEYELSVEQNRAVLLYDYRGQTIQFSMYMNDADSSYGQIEMDELVNEYEIVLDNDMCININEYEVPNKTDHRYAAEFQYQDARYQLIGIMKKEEFEKIINYLQFYE